jgi:DNA-binding transcriptional ArsR family regulator
MRIQLTSTTYARTTMAISPLVEVALSLRELAGLQCSVALRPWKRDVLRAVQGLDLTPVRALFAERDYADILSPPPTTASADIHSQLDWLVGQSEQLEKDIGRLYRGAVPAAAREYVHAPQAALHRLAETLDRYWSLAVAPWWPRLSALLEQDLLYRSQLAMRETLPHMIDRLHPDMSVTDDAFVFHPSRRSDRRVLEVGSQGLTFVPCTFITGKPMVTATNVWDRTAIFYPARGVGNLTLDDGAPAAADPLAVLLSRRRADLLRAIRTPATPSELARLMDVTSSAVSQQLTHLVKAGLAIRTPLGRKAYYRLTDQGTHLLRLLDDVG